jgi:FKBP-type peptidyl-prolyl cis-trans isomerase (trigger factor)
MHTVVRLEDERGVELEVEADWAEIRADYDDLVSSYGALAVPGFRPGRAPGKQVERHFRKEIRADVISRCVERLSRQAIEAEKLNPVGPVSVSDVELEPGRPFRFLVRFTSAPEFDIPDLAALVLPEGTDAARRDAASVWLLQNTDTEVPDAVVEWELSFQADSSATPGSAEWNAARDRAKLLLVLRAIARRDGIDVDDRDIDERIETMAGNLGTTARQLRNELLQKGGLRRIRVFILAERTLDYLLEISGRL